MFSTTTVKLYLIYEALRLSLSIVILLESTVRVTTAPFATKHANLLLQSVDIKPRNPESVIQICIRGGYMDIYKDP